MKESESEFIRCIGCGRVRATVDGLCDYCTIKIYGGLNLQESRNRKSLSVQQTKALIYET